MNLEFAPSRAYRQVRGQEDPEYQRQMQQLESPAFNRSVVSTEPRLGYVLASQGPTNAWVSKGWMLVPCHGEVHSVGNEHVSECQLCKNAPSSWRAVRG